METLPWVAKDSIRPNLGKQQVRFGMKNRSDFNLDEVKQAIESKTPFKVGKVVEGPTEPQHESGAKKET